MRRLSIGLEPASLYGGVSEGAMMKDPGRPRTDRLNQTLYFVERGVALYAMFKLLQSGRFEEAMRNKY